MLKLYFHSSIVSFPLFYFWFEILQNLLAESPFNGPQMNDDFEDDFSDELPGYSADDASDVQSEMSVTTIHISFFETKLNFES